MKPDAAVGDSAGYGSGRVARFAGALSASTRAETKRTECWSKNRNKQPHWFEAPFGKRSSRDAEVRSRSLNIYLFRELIVCLQDAPDIHLLDKHEHHGRQRCGDKHPEETECFT